MKTTQSLLLSKFIEQQLQTLGQRLRTLRIAQRLGQAECATRANLSRETASRIERGLPSVAIGQVLRYLDAMAPGRTLESLYTIEDSSLIFLQQNGQRQRARRLSPAELEKYDF